MYGRSVSPQAPRATRIPQQPSVFLPAFLLLFAVTVTGAQETVPEVKLLAEVRAPATDAAHAMRLVPADKLHEGQEIYYTLRIRNPGNTPLTTVSVIQAVPQNTHYVVGSATGAGAEIAFSVDGGRRFAKPAELRAIDEGALLIPAAQYTHIRWQLPYTLAPKAVLLARFRAVFQ